MIFIPIIEEIENTINDDIKVVWKKEVKLFYVSEVYGSVGRFAVDGDSNKFKNMEGIANFIIPMLKNQTVNTNPHLFSIHKLKSTKT